MSAIVNDKEIPGCFVLDIDVQGEEHQIKLDGGVWALSLLKDWVMEMFAR